MTESLRLSVFLDWQNVYNHAREAFHARGDHHTKGQVHPGDLADTLAGRSPEGETWEVNAVRIYRGVPDQARDPRGYAAARRQMSVWNQDARVILTTRTLRYPPDYKHGLSSVAEVKEKGIDVALALDLVTMATDEAYDVAILVSCDHDLAPAVERVGRRRKTRGGGPRVEVASWQATDSKSPRLRVPGERLPCHWLDQQTYWGLEDGRDYSRPSPVDMNRRG